MQPRLSLFFNAVLFLTGFVARRYAVVITTHGTDFPVSITSRAFTALADLILARLDAPASGRSTLPSIDEASRTTAIYDLRTTIDDAMGVDGAGHELIQNAFWGEYALMIPATNIHVSPAFRDLAPRHLSESVVTRILAAASNRLA